MSVPMPPATSRAPDWLYRVLVRLGAIGTVGCLVIEFAGVRTDGLAIAFAGFFAAATVNVLVSWAYVRSRRGRRNSLRARRRRP